MSIEYTLLVNRLRRVWAPMGDSPTAGEGDGEGEGSRVHHPTPQYDTEYIN